MKAFLISLTFVVILSIGAKFGADHIITKDGDQLERSWKLIEPDTELLWRNKKSLNEIFYGKTVTTNVSGLRHREEAFTGHIVVLGPSSTFGWGVADDETYSSIMSVKVETLNAGQIGYSSFQGVKFFSEMIKTLKRKPKFFIVAYGINDFDRTRFFFNSPNDDVDAFKNLPANFMIEMAKFGNELLFPNLLVKRLSQKSFRACPAFFPDSQRLTLSETMKAFQVLKDDITASGSEMVILNTAQKFSLEPVQDWESKMAHLIREFKASTECSQKAFIWSQLTELERSRIHYRTLALNQQLREWAEDTGIKYIDISHLSGDPANFIDPVHFSARGNKLIADEILKSLGY